MQDTPTNAYAARRARLMDAIGEDAVAIFVSGDEKLRSRDTDYRYRAHSDVLYLTGFEEPEAILVIAPGHDEGATTLFVRPRDKERETWTGRRAGPEGAVADFGADTAHPLEELDDKLPDLMRGREVLYVELGRDAAFDARIHRLLGGLRRAKNRPPEAPTVLKDPREVLHAMRKVKGEEELALLRRSCEIAAEAHLAAMKACKPGMHEYELQALIEYVFARNGASFPAYSSIVGGGDNATILHYTTNRDLLRDGDLVLIDAGCEFNYYASDITRTFPVSGSFTPAQRDLYQAVLEAEEAAIAMCTVGSSWWDIHQATVRTLTQAMIDLKLLKGSLDELIEEEAYKAFYMHKTGHWLGMDVHDVGPYYDGEDYAKLSPGEVQTIEPGIYVSVDAEDVPDEMRGIGIRIEDDVLTTEDGPVVLTGGVPKSVEALEDVVGSGYSFTV
ncbi:MAG: Xaa-Pro aminopeptidase [Myxococcales bacterium]|nr:Xaa-Pro aminopeptidase [Myxococcales bacterium]